MNTPSALVRVVLVASIIPLGCQIVAGLERPDGGDAWVDAGSGDAGAPPPFAACDPELPDAALVRGAGGDLAIELVFGFYTTALNPQADAGEVCPTSGFDLDRQPCILPVAPPDGGVDADVPTTCRTSCGNDPGIDDIGGDKFAKLRSVLPGTSNAQVLDPVFALEHASGNIMFRIVDYNGGAEDDEVGVQFYALTGFRSDTRPLADGSVDAAGWELPWDRHELREWSVDPSTIIEPLTLAPKSTVQGFVTRNVLVLHAAAVPFVFAGVLMNVERATVTGELRKTGEAWSLVRGRLGGEVRRDTLVTLMRTLAGRDQALCAALPGLSTTVCENMDRGRNGVCDAISIGASFTMVEGRLGELRPPSAPAEPCEADVTCQ